MPPLNSIDSILESAFARSAKHVQLFNTETSTTQCTSFAAFPRNSKPPGIQTRQMSTTCAGVATTSGDVILNFAPHPSQKRRPSRCIALCFARPSRDARNSPSSVSYADRDPDTPEPISSWSVNHFRATRLGHVQLQCSRATCGYAYPSEKLMQVLHIQLLQGADEIGWGLEHLAGNRDGCLSG